MRTAAIICEYNPFHAGHRYQIEALRRTLGPDTAVLCLMSGNYVQRGEPAIFDKWSRARAAVEGGADLVLELPLTAAVNAAGYFAAGAVDCLERLHGVDFLCFGSEYGTAEQLCSAARRMNSGEYEAALRDILKTGMSFAKAREEALTALGGDGALLSAPNSALGIDYLRRMLEQGGSMEPVVIPRDSSFPSASELRAQLTATGAESVHTLQNGERAMLAVLRTLPDEAFRRAPFGSEGLWSKVMRACRREDTVEAILSASKSRRYAMSRLKRMLLCLFLGLTAEDMVRTPSYLRILAFNDRGRTLLRTLKETSAIPLVDRRVPDTPEARAGFALERRSTDLYALFAPAGVTEPMGREKTRRPAYLRGLSGV